MQKQQLIESVLIELTGGDPGLKSQSKYHPEVLSLHIGMVFNGLVSAIKDSNLIDQFCINYENIPVMEDVNLNIKYSTLPTTILNTEFFSGVRSVTPMKDQSSTFFKRKNNSLPVFRYLESSAYTKLAYHIQGQRVIYDEINNGLDEVLLNLLVPFDQIADTDEIAMPGGKDSDVFMMVLEQLRQQTTTPQSYKSDNNSNP